MKTPKHLRRAGLIAMLAGLAAAPLGARACDPLSTLLQWAGLPASCQDQQGPQGDQGQQPPASCPLGGCLVAPPTADGPGSCPTGNGC
jgi:hypothetical protein